MGTSLELVIFESASSLRKMINQRSADLSGDYEAEIAEAVASHT
jgi:hypothetical protein